MAQDTSESKAGSPRKTHTKPNDAIGQGVADGKQAAAEAVPVVGDYLAKALYDACYYSAYGVTFGALFIANMIPSESPVARGLHDGAETASREFKVQEEQRSRRATAESGGATGVPMRAGSSTEHPAG
jgi:hypothetical protein